MKDSFSRIVSLWLIFILCIAFLTELGCAVGLIPVSVLEAVAYRSSSWWRQPLWLHAIHSLLLAVAAGWLSILLLAPGVSSRMGMIGGGAAVLLSSHLSPVYVTVPFIPLGGTILALLILGWLLLQSRTGLNPCGRLRQWLPAGRLDRIIWGVFGLIVLYCFLSQFGETSRLVSRKTDFGIYYEAASALLGGDDPYRATGGGYFYPPTFAFYFRLVTWLPKAGASLLWFASKLALVIWSFVVVDGLLQGQNMQGTRRRWFVVGIVFVAARFLLADLQYGNVNSVILWLCLMAVHLDSKGRSALAGCAAAAAISIKVVPVLFLVYFMVRGRIRVALWAVVWLCALNLFPFVFASQPVMNSWTAYLVAGGRSMLGSPLAQPDNQSLWGALNRSLHGSFPQIRLIWMLCSVFLTAVAASLAYRTRREGPTQKAGAASLFFLLGLLVSPGSWVVHYSAVLMPMAYLLHEAMACRPPSWSLWAVFAAASVVFTVSGWARFTVRLSIEQSWFVMANCMVFFTIVFLLMCRTGVAGKRHER